MESIEDGDLENVYRCEEYPHCQHILGDDFAGCPLGFSMETNPQNAPDPTNSPEI